MKDLKNNKILLADIQCLTAAFLFGIGFLGQREISVDGLGPMTCNAFRFGLSTILLLVCLPFMPYEGHKEKSSDIDEQNEVNVIANDDSVDLEDARLIQKEKENYEKSEHNNSQVVKNIFDFKTLKKTALFWGFTLGTLNFLGSGFQQWGITMTSASKVAFIAGFDLFLTPIFGLFIPTFKLNGAPQLSTWLAVNFSLVGLFLLSDASIYDFEIGMGETLTLVSTVFWTLHITYTDIATTYVDTISMITIQFGFVTLFSACAAVYFEPHQWEWNHMYTYWHWIIFLSVVDGLGFLLMAQGQNFAPPTHAAIILSLEGVFASVASYFFIGEHLSHNEIIGCVIMLISTLMAEIGIPIIDNYPTCQPCFKTHIHPPLTSNTLEYVNNTSSHPPSTNTHHHESKSSILHYLHRQYMHSIASLSTWKYSVFKGNDHHTKANGTDHEKS